MEKENLIAIEILKFIKEPLNRGSEMNLTSIIAQGTFFKESDFPDVFQYLRKNNFIEPTETNEIKISDSGKEELLRLEKELKIEKEKEEVVHKLFKAQLGIASYQNKWWYKILAILGIVLGISGGIYGLIKKDSSNQNKPNEIITKEYLKHYVDSIHKDKLDSISSDTTVIHPIK